MLLARFPLKNSDPSDVDMGFDATTREENVGPVNFELDWRKEPVSGNRLSYCRISGSSLGWFVFCVDDSQAKTSGRSAIPQLE